MSRRGALAAVVLGCVALTLAGLIVARVSSRGGTAPPVLASSPPVAPAATAAPPVPDCAWHPPAAAGSTLRMSGACRGELNAPFGCVAAVDDLYLTGRQGVDAAHILYLTVNVESYRRHPGDYAGAQAVLQLTGPFSVERWSNYGVGVHVNADHSVVVPSTALAADPGTGSSGTVTISGAIGCGA